MSLNIRCFFYSLSLIMLLCVRSFSQSPQPFAPFTLYGKILQDDKPVENVTLELSKDGQVLKTITTTKNGKYSFVMMQDTVNRKNEYIVRVSKEGTVTKMLVVNTYIPKNEYDDNNFDYQLEITMIPTKVNDIIIQRPSGKIKWNDSENSYGIDQVYAKIIQKEEEQLKEDPDKFLKELAERMKKEEEEKKRKEEEANRKAAEEEAKKKAEEEEAARKAAEELARKAEEQAAITIAKEKEIGKDTLNKDRITVENELVKTELKERDSAPDTTRMSPQKIQIRATIPVVNSTPEPFDHVTQYQLKKSRIDLEKRKRKEERTKSNNLAAKYETSNVMSSLLDAVDEHDKRLKNK